MSAITMNSAVGTGTRRLMLCLAVVTSLGTGATAHAEAVTSDRPDALAIDVQRARGSFEDRSAQHPPPHQGPPVHRLVTSCADSGSGSLRSVVAQSISGDTVDLTHLSCSKITLTTGYVVVGVKDLTLKGPGAGLLEISGNNKSSVLQHFGSGMLQVDYLTISDGKYVSDTTPWGGCIYSTGSVFLTGSNVRNCTVVGNATTAAQGGAIFAKNEVFLDESSVTGSGVFSIGEAAAYGGGVYAGNEFHCKYSSVNGNTASAVAADRSGYGGGIWSMGNGDVEHSTIAGNSAQVLAGMVLMGETYAAPMFVIQSTISGNVSSDSRFGSGLFVGQTAYVANSTIADNTEDNPGHRKYGAGISMSQGVVVTLKSTIVSGNVIAGTTRYDDIGGRGSLTGAHNLIRLSQLPYPPTTLHGDPKLGPLANNGGTTLTRALSSGSPAIDAGESDVPTTTWDQRGVGYPRIKGAGPDIGALEQ